MLGVGDSSVIDGPLYVGSAVFDSSFISFLLFVG